MLDSALAEILKQGLGYVLFVATAIVAGVLWRHTQTLNGRILEIQREGDGEIRDLNEKRLEETKAVVIALERSTVAATDRAAALATQAAAVENLTKGFAAMVITDENTRNQFTDLGKRIEERQQEALKLLREIASGHK